MTIMLVFSALALSMAPPAAQPTSTPAATDTKQCDAKPFTLKKPVQMATSAPAPRPAAKPKPKIVIGCKQPAAKVGG